MICEFCGQDFKPDKALHCKGCQLGQSDCTGIRCPFCFYEMIPEPKWIQKLFSLFGMKKKTNFNPDQVLLNSIPLNQEAYVTRLDFKNKTHLKKMIALGILPGTAVKVIQKYPSCVFKAGETQLSIDRELASCIYVKSAAAIS